MRKGEIRGGVGTGAVKGSIELFIMQSPVATVHPVKQGAVQSYVYSNAFEQFLFLCILHT